MEAEGTSDNHNNNNASAQNNSWNLTPVAPEQYGEGLPYAPENWPNPGDVWGWRTGRRVTLTGYFADRYLYPPTRLGRVSNPGSSRRSRKGFASKLSVERYIKESFPHVQVDDFFASFSWKIPFMQPDNTQPIAAVPLQQLAPNKQSESDLYSGVAGCKAGNQMCSSLILKEEENYSPGMPCDICCAEPHFCCDCCCILCCKAVDSAYGGYSYIKCQKAIAQELLSHIKLAISKLKCGCGTNTEDILNVDDNLAAHSAGLSDNSNAEMDVTANESPLDDRIGTESFGYLSDSTKLEVEVDQVLQDLRKSQEYEYNLAEERLNAHKNYLQNLYQQLDLEKSELIMSGLSGILK
ncbi:Oberon, PHD finger domain [Sesbania bispinosa]|nr:Oberon, PHD finger domain [Sesbania bispinosa]